MIHCLPEVNLSISILVQCINQTCDNKDGNCTYGCEDGYHTKTCQKECNPNCDGKFCTTHCNCVKYNMPISSKLIYAISHVL